MMIFIPGFAGSYQDAKEIQVFIGYELRFRSQVIKLSSSEIEPRKGVCRYLNYSEKRFNFNEKMWTAFPEIKKRKI